MARRGKDRYAVALLVMLAVACAGREPMPVMVYQAGDKDRACEVLANESDSIESAIEKLLTESAKTDETNTALGVTGVFLLVPLFFMDLSDADRIEVNALRLRYNHLLQVADTKGCHFARVEIPPFPR